MIIYAGSVASLVIGLAAALVWSWPVGVLVGVLCLGLLLLGWWLWNAVKGKLDSLSLTPSFEGWS